MRIPAHADLTQDYDAAHERKLADAVIAAIAETSLCDRVLVLRTGELARRLDQSPGDRRGAVAAGSPIARCDQKTQRAIPQEAPGAGPPRRG